jgi:phage shock protein A
MVFGFFKKKQADPGPQDPLVHFDQVIAALERQGVEVRRSAATLLALRSELKADCDRYQQRLGELERKLKQAGRDPKAENTLRSDLEEVQRLLDRSHEALNHAQANAQLLLTAAQELKGQLAELTAERQSARARMRAGLMVSEALKAQVQNFERLMKLDAARDEVEKAHALAELYREDLGR